MDEPAKQELVKKRGSCKASLTNSENFLATLELNESADYERLVFRYSKLKESLAKFEEVQDQLELVEEDTTEREQFYDKYSNVISRFEVLLRTKAHLKAVSTAPDATSHCSDNQSNITAQVNVKLPEIQIPIFDGQFANWTSFRDSFSDIVIGNNGISNVSKFYYLSSSLSGEPKTLIQNLQPSDINFGVAWGLLKQRYDNPRLIATAHIKTLFNPPVLQKNSSISLRSIIDHFASNVQALEAMDLDNVSVRDLILIQMILNTLDSATIKDWETATSSNKIPSFDELLKFLEKRCKILEALNVGILNPHPKTTSNAQLNVASAASSTNSAKGYYQRLQNDNFKPQCNLCKLQHYLSQCDIFKSWSVQQRWRHVKSSQLCYNCLTKRGQNHKCSLSTCRHCHQRHHTSLHEHYNQPHSDDPSMTKTPPSGVPNPSAITFRPTNQQQLHDNRYPRSDNKYQGQSQSNQVQVSYASNSVSVTTPKSSAPRQTVGSLLPTARVHVRDSSGKLIVCTALLDSGSNCNLITGSLVYRLKLPTRSSQTIIDGISGQHSISNGTVDLEINSCHTAWRARISAVMVDNISCDLPATSIDPSAWNLPPNIAYADEQCFTPKPIELLLGSNIFFKVLCAGKFEPSNDQPIIQNTYLGWIFAGNVPGGETHTPEINRVSSRAIISRTQIHEQLENFWKVEEIDKRLPTSEEALCEEHFVLNTHRNSEGRYVVRLPRKIDADPVGQSRSMAFRRFQSLEHRFSRQPELKQSYVEFMQEYLMLGHMEPIPVSAQNDSNECYHIPHHPVFKPDSTSTKLRVVFDASAKSNSGSSLNDTLMVGPVIQQDLFSITLRFRTHPIAFAADISKMYRQVLVHPDDHDLQRIFWRDSPSEPIQEFRLKTVTYGTASASFLATRALKQLIIDEGEDFPLASPIVASDFYVDDCISGCESETQALAIHRELNNLLPRGGFQLRKWSTNSSVLLQAIPLEDRETQSCRGFASTDETVVKTLGLLWQPQEDNFYIQTPLLHKTSHHKLSKRILLSEIAGIFDPLGLIAPVVISCKMLFQSLWLENLGWDDQLPGHIVQAWTVIVEGLPNIATIAIPRFVSCIDVVSSHLHGFCDSSERAYGACFYLLTCGASGQCNTRLLCAKSKVAPVKQLTLPKLELCAALLLAKLLAKVQSSLTITISSITLWSDSTVVLSWIAAPPQRWKTFVANRVSEIQSLTGRCVWKHVTSRDNPADLISRGVNPTELKGHSLWWSGPVWLNEASSEEKHTFSSPSLDELPERRICRVAIAKTDFDSYLLQRYSSFPKMLRIVALCKRFAHNCRNSSRLSGPLTTKEIEDALVTSVQIVQRQHFHAELSALINQQALSPKSTIFDLNPFLHSDGTLRVGGRIQRSLLPFDTKHQLILPNCHFARKLIRHTHMRLLHGGINLIISDIRQRFWIPGIRRLVRSVTRTCLTCFRFNPRANTQIMGQLPACRVQPAHPFLNVGVDYAGPIAIRHGGPRSKTTAKAYVALFVCMATKAIHIEAVTSLTSAAFLAAFARFYSRRGIPSIVWSDNGSNFLGAKRELSEIGALLSSSSFQKLVQDSSAKLAIQWNFIPPCAPHFGGLWEANIKSMKFHLHRSISGQLLTYEELATVLIQVEAVMNSRPIAPLSDDTSDLCYLSPGHFLIGRALTTLPSPDLHDLPVNRLTRWQHLQRITAILWRKWSADYLQSLQRRAKWQRESPNLEPNAIVLLKEDNVPPLHWRMARVHEVHPGPDGKVRVATLYTIRGFVKRSISRICPLPFETPSVSSEACGEPMAL